MRGAVLRRILGFAIVIAVLSAPVAGAEALRVRKSVQDLKASERADFVTAVLRLKTTPSPYTDGLSWYDQFVAWHVFLMRCEATDPLLRARMNGHAGPMFLPWHREFVLLLEDALRKVSRKPITVPYWDWAAPGSMQSVFTDDFMGGDGDPNDGFAVKTGPFTRLTWPLRVHNEGLVYGRSKTNYLARNFGSTGAVLPTVADVEEALGRPTYDVAPYNDGSDPAVSFRNSLEGARPSPPAQTSGCMPDGWSGRLPFGTSKLHNVVHVYVGGGLSDGPDGQLRGGTLTATPASPNDPVFFLHHAQVDRLWAKWQELHPGQGYQPLSGLEHNSIDDPLLPLPYRGRRPVTPRRVEDVTKLGYAYADPGESVSEVRRRAQRGRGSRVTRRELICVLKGRAGTVASAA